MPAFEIALLRLFAWTVICVGPASYLGASEYELLTTAATLYAEVPQLWDSIKPDFRAARERRDASLQEHGIQHNSLPRDTLDIEKEEILSTPSLDKHGVTSAPSSEAKEVTIMIIKTSSGRKKPMPENHSVSNIFDYLGKRDKGTCSRPVETTTKSHVDSAFRDQSVHNTTWTLFEALILTLEEWKTCVREAWDKNLRALQSLLPSSIASYFGSTNIDGACEDISSKNFKKDRMNLQNIDLNSANKCAFLSFSGIRNNVAHMLHNLKWDYKQNVTQKDGTVQTIPIMRWLLKRLLVVAFALFYLYFVIVGMIKVFRYVRSQEGWDGLVEGNIWFFQRILPDWIFRFFSRHGKILVNYIASLWFSWYLSTRPLVYYTSWSPSLTASWLWRGAASLVSSWVLTFATCHLFEWLPLSRLSSHWAYVLICQLLFFSLGLAALYVPRAYYNIGFLTKFDVVAAMLLFCLEITTRKRRKETAQQDQIDVGFRPRPSLWWSTSLARLRRTISTYRDPGYKYIVRLRSMFSKFTPSTWLENGCGYITNFRPGYNRVRRDVENFRNHPAPFLLKFAAWTPFTIFFLFNFGHAVIILIKSGCVTCHPNWNWRLLFHFMWLLPLFIINVLVWGDIGRFIERRQTGLHFTGLMCVISILMLMTSDTMPWQIESWMDVHSILFLSILFQSTARYWSENSPHLEKIPGLDGVNGDNDNGDVPPNGGSGGGGGDRSPPPDDDAAGGGGGQNILPDSNSKGGGNDDIQSGVSDNRPRRGDDGEDGCDVGKKNGSDNKKKIDAGQANETDDNIAKQSLKVSTSEPEPAASSSGSSAPPVKHIRFQRPDSDRPHVPKQPVSQPSRATPVVTRSYGPSQIFASLLEEASIEPKKQEPKKDARKEDVKKETAQNDLKKSEPRREESKEEKPSTRTKTRRKLQAQPPVATLQSEGIRVRDFQPPNDPKAPSPDIKKADNKAVPAKSSQTKATDGTTTLELRPSHPSSSRANARSLDSMSGQQPPAQSVPSARPIAPTEPSSPPSPSIPVLQVTVPEQEDESNPPLPPVGRQIKKASSRLARSKGKSPIAPLPPVLDFPSTRSSSSSSLGDPPSPVTLAPSTSSSAPVPDFVTAHIPPSDPKKPPSPSSQASDSSFDSLYDEREEENPSTAHFTQPGPSQPLTTKSFYQFLISEPYDSDSRRSHGSLGSSLYAPANRDKDDNENIVAEGGANNDTASPTAPGITDTAENRSLFGSSPVSPRSQPSERDSFADTATNRTLYGGQGFEDDESAARQEDGGESSATMMPGLPSLPTSAGRGEDAPEDKEPKKKEKEKSEQTMTDEELLDNGFSSWEEYRAAMGYSSEDE